MTTLYHFSNPIVKDKLDKRRFNAFSQKPLQRQSLVDSLGHVPSKSDVRHLADRIFDYLFPNNDRQAPTKSVRYTELMEQLRHLLDPLAIDTTHVIQQFSAALPALYGMMISDAKAALASDPAATSLTEIIVAYPGFYATAIYRLAHALLHLNVPLLPRMLTEYAHSQTGIDIHPAAEIGRAFVIDHGTGTVIGATARIGNHVQLYHGVTLGALQVHKSMAGTKRHPTLEDHVTVYANATILGGETVIGHHSIIGGNVWLTDSVPPHSQVYHKAEVSVRTKDR
ncbi:MAG: serine acetyltransferase [Anaerolineae bacterium]|nr:serine acetyltransferase [Anaerolineae bacterium]